VLNIFRVYNSKKVANENICSLMFLCMFFIFFTKVKKTCFYLQINVFNVYAVKCHLNSSNGWSTVHECNRRHSDNKLRYAEVCTFWRNRLH